MTQNNETDTKSNSGVSEQYIRQGENMLTDLIGLPLWRIKVGDKFGSLSENFSQDRKKVEQTLFYKLMEDIQETKRYKDDMPKELYDAIIKDLENSEIWICEINDNKLTQNFYKSFKELKDTYAKKH